MKTHTIIVSLDGVVFNTYTPIKQAISALAKQHNIEVEPYFFELYIDAGFQYRQRAFIHFPKLAELRTEIEQITPSIVQQIEHFNESFVPFYQYCQKEKIDLALISSLSQKIAQPLVDFLKQEGYQFSQQVFGNECFEGKPEHDLYQRLLAKLALKAKDTIAIESSVNGILASYQANIRNIYLENHDLRITKVQKYSQYQCERLQEISDLLERPL